MIPSVASAPKPTQECETHTVWQWSYGSSAPRHFSDAVKERISQLPTRTRGMVFDFGEQLAVPPQMPIHNPFWAESKNQVKALGSKPECCLNFCFWSAYFEAIHELFPNEG
jgi:hypothetical protein